MIVDKGSLHTAAADVEAALVLCPFKTDVSIPDFAGIVFSHREIVKGCQFIFLRRLPTAVVLTLFDASILFSWVCRSFPNSRAVT